MPVVTYKKLRLIGAATLAVLLSSGLRSLSAADPSTHTAAVSLRGLDLNAPQDQATLRHRLRVAAAKLCTEIGSPAMPSDHGFADCVQEAFKTAWTETQPLIASARSRALYAANAVSPRGAQPPTMVASSNRPAKLGQ